MKRLFLCLLTIVFAALCAVPALAQNTAYVCLPANKAQERVKLREAPNTGARVLGQYFNGVAVEILDAQGDWSHISIGGYEGYMMTKFLTRSEENTAFDTLGYARFPEEDGKLTVYQSPQSGAEIVDRIDGALDVLGTVGEDWLHMRCRVLIDEEDSFAAAPGAYGFVDSRAVTKTENLATVRVDTGKADERLNLRAAPNKGGDVLAKLYSGAALSVLFDDHPFGDGWQRVRVGDLCGYVMDEFLDYSSGQAHAFFPPLGQIKSSGENVAVLAESGDQYLIRRKTEERWAYDDVWIAKAGLTTDGVSASTAAATRRATAMYWQEEGGAPTQLVGAIAAGQEVVILSSYDPDKGETDAYVNPTHRWLFCDAQLEDGSWASGYVPRKDVLYDQRLELK